MTVTTGDEARMGRRGGRQLTAAGNYFDTRSKAVMASASGALPLLVIAILQPTFLRPGTLPLLAFIVAFTVVTVGITLRAGRLSDRQFTVLGSGGMVGVAISAYLIADPSGSRAVTAMLAVVPAIAASGSPPKVTISLTGAAVVMATALSINGSEGAVRFVAAGAAITTVVVPAVLIATMRSSLESVTARLETLANTDPLTGLLNRRGMLPRVSVMLAEASENSDAIVVSLVDVDHFKSVNDTRGHAAGDVVLTTVAEAIAACVPEDAVVARLGGEEFLVLGLSKSVSGLEEKVLESVRSACDVTVSIGVAQANVVFDDRGGNDVEATLDRLTYAADRALYAAKTAGRDRVAFAMEDVVRWSPTLTPVQRRDKTEPLR
ncbi:MULTISPECIES: GGDEF domain-containing protein [Nocardiaceae]|uniref:Diguanylate cyclase (GGDEF)-like protein n=1 Tax=Rhodococcoides corynebacterioides TaxID=53972 RepID=A0ABS2KYH3_9NOCA|nr:MULTISPECIES: GGDEF domain-containing protein [Rhodococcus]MBM7416979.1 diguanylate cyclase (GGDEF)-like protein [Rhodococcus corynebacterioides]MBP1115232.1 diguanylate cyclase (GGDEF)-like protein [Rhodococcus sp. PvP016]